MLCVCLSTVYADHTACCGYLSSIGNVQFVTDFHFGEVAEPGGLRESLIFGLEGAPLPEGTGVEGVKDELRRTSLSAPKAESGGLVASGDGMGGYEKEPLRPNADGGTGGGGMRPLPP